MLQSLSNTTLNTISPRWGLGYSAYTHFHRALPYAIDLKAFSLKPRMAFWLKAKNYYSPTATPWVEGEMIQNCALKGQVNEQ